MKRTTPIVIGLGFATSLFAITQEQQIKLDKVFQEYKRNIEQNQSLEESKKIVMLKDLENRKKEIEGKSDAEISSYLDQNFISKNENKKYEDKAIDDEVGWVFGALGARYTVFFGGKSGKTQMGYATIGAQYNFTENQATLLPKKGFSLSIPIGLGEINTINPKSNAEFVLPIAVEAKYLFSDFGFGFNAGLRYSYSPQNIGDLHIMDFYAGIDIYAGFYIQAGYVFFSSQNIKTSNKTTLMDPLSGAFALNVGWKF